MAVEFSPEQQAALMLTQARKNKLGSMNFPGVRQSWQDDELTGIAENLLKTGQSTAPVASGGWGFAEGLSRLGSGALGGLWAGKQRRKYEDEADRRAMEFKDLYNGGGGGQVATGTPMDLTGMGQAPQLAQPANPAAAQGPMGGNINNIAQVMTGVGGGAPPGNFPQPPAAPGVLPSQASQATTQTAGPVGAGQPGTSPRVLAPGESASPPGSRRRVGTRATRNNNPGNVKASGWTKQQPGYVGQDSGGFAIFDSVENGARAQQQLLRNYSRQGRNTIATIVPKWAPASDNNNVQAYVSAVSRATGIDPNKPLTDAEIPAVQAAMAKHEGFGGPGGGTGVVAAGATGGAGGAGGGTVEPWDVAPLPAAPERPEMPQIAESKPSQRRLLAERLMAGGDAMFPLMQANLSAGMEEEADLNKQREENIAQMQTTGYQSEMQTYGQMVAALQRAGLDERQAYIAANIALKQQQLENQGELEQERVRAETKANAGPTKVLPRYNLERLENTASTLQTSLNLGATFKDSFAGKGLGWAGNLQNWIAERTGDPKLQDQVNWWKQYDAMVGVVRNKLYGSALTEAEKRLWDRSDINPGTNPKQIRMHLERRIQIFENALKRHIQSDSAVYDNDQVEAAYGGSALMDALQSRTPVYQFGTDMYGKPIPGSTTMNGNTYPAPSTPQQKADDAYLQQKYGL